MEEKNRKNSPQKEREGEPLRVREKLAEYGGLTPEQYAGFTPSEKEVWDILIQSGGVSSNMSTRLIPAIESLEKKGLVDTKDITEKLPEEVPSPEAKAIEEETKPADLPNRIEELDEKLNEIGATPLKKLLEGKRILDLIMKGQDMAARQAFAEGKEKGIFSAKEYYQDMIKGAKERGWVQAEVRKMINDLKDIPKRLNKISPAEADPVREVLEDLDLIQSGKVKGIRLTKIRDWFERNKKHTELPDYIMEDLARIDKRAIRDLKVNELRSIHMSVMHYVTLNETKNKIEVGRELKEEMRVLRDCIAEMKSPKQIKSDIVSSQRDPLAKIKSTGQLILDTLGIRHDHFDLIIETLAGLNSNMYKVLYQTVKDGVTEELRYRQEAFENFQSDVNIDKFKEKYKIRDIGDWASNTIKVGKFDLSRGLRMSLYRHSLNPDNLRHLLQGGFCLPLSKTPFLAHKITKTELSDILDSLSSAELEYAGIGVTNLFEKQWKELNRVFYKKNGYFLPKEFRYFPIDVTELSIPHDVEAKSALEEFKNEWIRIGIKKGMLEKRKMSSLPINLHDINYVINKSVMNSAAYIGLEIPLSNASKLLYNKTFKAEMFNRYGPQTWIEIEKGLKDIAGNWQSYTTVQKLFIQLKNRLTTAILSISFAIPKQVLSFALYNVYVKPKYLLQGYEEYIMHPQEVIKRIKMYSPEFKERIEGGFERDIADIFKSNIGRRVYRGAKTISEKLMGGIKFFDLNAVAPGMYGAMLQTIDEFKNKKLSSEVKKALDMTEKDIDRLTPIDKIRLGYKFADWVTERTQPMFSAEHRDSLSRGAALEIICTNFRGFTSQALNLIRRTTREAIRTGDPLAYAKVAKVYYLLFVINTGGVMFINALADRIYKRKRDKRPLWKRYLEGVLDSVASYFVLLRDIYWSVKMKAKMGTWMGPDISIPVTEFGNKLAEAFVEGIEVFTKKGEKRVDAAQRFLDDALYVITATQGLPYQTPKRIITGLMKETPVSSEELNKWIDKEIWGAIYSHLQRCELYPDEISQKDLRSIIKKSSIPNPSAQQVKTLAETILTRKTKGKYKPPQPKGFGKGFGEGFGKGFGKGFGEGF